MDRRAPFDLTGRVACVTGAASGIGAASATVLAGAGASVVLADVDEAGARHVAETISNDGGTALVQPTDIRRSIERSTPTSKARCLAPRPPWLS